MANPPWSRRARGGPALLVGVLRPDVIGLWFLVGLLGWWNTADALRLEFAAGATPASSSGSVSQVDTTGCLTGGPITTTGTITSATCATLNQTNTFTGRQDATGAASTAPLKIGTTTPGTCGPGDLFFKLDATQGQSIYQCNPANTWTQQLNSSGGGISGATNHGLIIATAATTATSLGVATNGQLPIGSTGADPVLGAITGTANRISVTLGAGTIALTTPQDTHTAAKPTFAGAILTAFNAWTAVAAPATPAAGIANVYVDSTSKKLCVKDDAGAISCTGVGDALVANPLSQFASTTSAQLAGVLSNETGTGLSVFNDTPTLITPILGTPTSATLTNATGLPISTGVSGLATGIATLLGTPSSANLLAALTTKTGTGLAVFNDTPSLITPALGVATATGMTITSASATTCLTVGPAGTTSPSLQVDCSTVSAISGMKVTSAATGAGVLVESIGGTNEALKFKSKGTANVSLDTASTSGAVTVLNSGNTRVSIADTTFVVTPAARTSGALAVFRLTSNSDTALTLSTEAPIFHVNMNQTHQHATGALTLQRDAIFETGTHTFVGASTLSQVAGLAISGPPNCTTNATCTQSEAVLIETKAVSSTVTNAYGMVINAPSGAATINRALKLSGDLELTNGRYIGGLGYIQLPVAAAKLPTTNAALIDQSEARPKLLFDATTSWCASWTFHLNNDYGTSPVVMFDYSMTSATTGTASLGWSVWKTTTAEAVDAQTTSYATVNTCTDAAVPGTAGYMERIACTLTNDDGMVANDLITLQVCRDISDTATGNLELMGAALQYNRQ